MDDKPRCQSCGMPLGEPGFYGTNADGAENRAYCKYCFQSGNFTMPEMTLSEAVEASVTFMSEKMDFSEEEARRLSQEIIPRLGRWRSA